MLRLVPYFIAYCLLGAAFTFAQSVGVAGKQLTDRSIELIVIVNTTPASAYKMWTNPKFANKFFGTESTIDPRPGGAYEIYFAPRVHNSAESNSSKGAKVLWAEPGKRLAFEWSIPPFAPALKAIRPFPLWVELEFRPLGSDKTVLSLKNHGYGRGAEWDNVYEFFVRNWSIVLFRFERYLVTGEPNDSWPIPGEGVQGHASTNKKH